MMLVKPLTVSTSSTVGRMAARTNRLPAALASLAQTGAAGIVHARQVEDQAGARACRLEEPLLHRRRADGIEPAGHAQDRHPVLGRIRELHRPFSPIPPVKHARLNL
jgi:hypothetical protein